MRNPTIRQSYLPQTTVYRLPQYLMPPPPYSSLSRSNSMKHVPPQYVDCENVHQHHRKNHIYFIVDPIKKTYCQKCHDPQCFDFESVVRIMSTNQAHAPVRRRPLSSTYDLISPKRLRRDIEITIHIFD
jgi:hypothetical protein